jgi:arsenate reductase
MITLYGIPNCDTVKKARTWLSSQQLDFTFHDFKKQGIDEATLRVWIAAIGLDKLVNRARWCRRG